MPLRFDAREIELEHAQRLAILPPQNEIDGRQIWMRVDNESREGAGLRKFKCRRVHGRIVSRASLQALRDQIIAGLEQALDG